MDTAVQDFQNVGAAQYTFYECTNGAGDSRTAVATGSTTLGGTVYAHQLCANWASTLTGKPYLSYASSGSCFQMTAGDDFTGQGIVACMYGIDH